MKWRDMPAALRLLLTNPIYMCLTLGHAGDTLLLQRHRHFHHQVHTDRVHSSRGKRLRYTEVSARCSPFNSIQRSLPGAQFVYPQTVAYRAKPSGVALSDWLS